MECFTVKNLSFSYPGANKKALDNVTVHIAEGSFVLLCGKSGSGKSTLLRHFKTCLAPVGEKQGSVYFYGKELNEVDFRTQTEKIGFVSQSPESQTVTDKVYHEISFCLENLGVPSDEIRRKVAFAADFFGLSDSLNDDVAVLSGGQKQLLSLAGVVVSEPQVLILDEPTSQLDPKAAAEFVELIARLNRETGITVIMSEQRLNEALPFADTVIVLDGGRVVCCDTPENTANFLKENNSGLLDAFPAGVRLWCTLDGKEKCPVTVSDGRAFLKSYSEKNSPSEISIKEYSLNNNTALSASHCYFRYEKDGADIIKDFSFSLEKGEIFALVGANGAGKTTALKILSGAKKCVSGKVERFGKSAFLPQDAKTLFVKDTVLDDLYEVFDSSRAYSEKEARIKEIAEMCGINHLLTRNPFELSGGETQLSALAKLLVNRPDILFLDEPTKGLDAELKKRLGTVLKTLSQNGVAVLLVSHDTDFCAEYADMCGVFFDGTIISKDVPQRFFSDSSFCSTNAARIAKNIVPNAVTVDEILSSFNKDITRELSTMPKENPIKTYAEINEKKEESVVVPSELPGKKRLSPIRKALCAVLSVLSVADFVLVSFGAKISTLTGVDINSFVKKNNILLYALLIVLLFGAALSAVGFSGEKKTIQKRNKMSGKSKLLCVASVLAVIVTLIVGVFVLNNKNSGIISVIVLTECIVPFFIDFDGRKPGAREIVTLSTLCALGVAGRMALFMLPQFKPVMAVVIIAGASMGAKSGFLTGAVTMLVSNMFYSQGPWTPWQMFSMGLVGFIAGLIFNTGILQPKRFSMAVYGAAAAIIIYGGIMNPASVIMYSPASLSIKSLLASYASGFIADIVQASATVFFILCFGEKSVEKIKKTVRE